MFFDDKDPSNRGRPTYFDIDKYTLLIEQMIAAEEIERAFWMLDNPPGWFRMNPPPAFKIIREKLYQQLHTTIDYSNDGTDDLSKFTDEELVKYGNDILRYKEAIGLVKDLNDNNNSPLVIELAPGSGQLLAYLKANNLKFSYKGIGLGSLITHETEKPDCSIFVCFEVIEHLSNPTEIYHHAVKQGLNFDFIMLSTPYCTWRGGFPNWYEMKLGHLRTYTPKEFIEFGVKHWPSVQWKVIIGDEMVLMGSLPRETKDPASD